MEENELAIRSLFDHSVDEAVQMKQTDEDVRITDIEAANDRSVGTKFRKVLASRSLVIEYREWLRSRGYSRKDSTSKVYMEDMGMKYKKYKYHYARAEKILKYEHLAVPTISIIFVFCWGKAIQNKCIDGFVHALKNDYKPLYTLLEERVDWFKRCQSIYDSKFALSFHCNLLTELEQCEVRNKNTSVDRIFVPYFHNGVDQAPGCDKRKLPAENGEKRNCRSRGISDREDQTTEVATEQAGRSSTTQGLRIIPCIMCTLLTRGRRSRSRIAA